MDFTRKCLNELSVGHNWLDSCQDDQKTQFNDKFHFHLARFNISWILRSLLKISLHLVSIFLALIFVRSYIFISIFLALLSCVSLCLLQRYINLVFIIIRRCGISLTNCILFFRLLFSHFLFLNIKVLCSNYPYFLCCVRYFLRLSLLHTRVLSEILSSRGFHTQYIDSQFWLGNWYLWICIYLPVLLKQNYGVWCMQEHEKGMQR